MDEDLSMRRKWTLKAHGRQIVLVKKPDEKTSHVFMKAFLWALYLPDYPHLTVEVHIGDRYKPDLVSLRGDGTPAFWGEAGYVGDRKVKSLIRRYRSTHFAFAKWAAPVRPIEDTVRKALKGVRPTGGPGPRIDLVRFPPDSMERFIRRGGRMRVPWKDLEVIRLP